MPLTQDSIEIVEDIIRKHMQELIEFRSSFQHHTMEQAFTKLSTILERQSMILLTVMQMIGEDNIALSEERRKLIRKQLEALL